MTKAEDPLLTQGVPTNILWALLLPPSHSSSSTFSSHYHTQLFSFSSLTPFQSSSSFFVSALYRQFLPVLHVYLQDAEIWLFRHSICIRYLAYNVHLPFTFISFGETLLLVIPVTEFRTTNGLLRQGLS
ncbi:hypothetical protein VNO80_16120 [Phaseolus coccineus]|uniref:Uncharacterized protein n=1 Tax=Phaseolus coccineus TaxID=3886 RepID=A0AAN9R2W3_PHACN